MTNKELGRKIWANINFTNGYADNFDAWYNDCFGECMEEAANEIFNGTCEYKRGSFVEVSRSISKSGNPVTIDVDKENFIEYYGASKCMELFEL